MTIKPQLNTGDMIKVKSGKVGMVLRVCEAGAHYTNETVEYTATKNGKRFGPIRYARIEAVSKVQENQ